MVMGLDGAKRILASNPDLMAHLIYDNHGKNGVWFSPSLKDKIGK
jgi:thiamine biosynthesis lipoprotein